MHDHLHYLTIRIMLALSFQFSFYKLTVISFFKEGVLTVLFNHPNLNICYGKL